MQVPTKRIVSPESPGGVVVINESDFDPKRHREAKTGRSEAEPSQGTEDSAKRGQGKRG